LITTLRAIGIQIDTETFLKILGDDSLIGIVEHLNLQDVKSFISKFANEAKRRFGAILNVRKSEISHNINDLSFLGYRINGGLPVRDNYKLLAQLLYPERQWNFNTLAARAIGIAWASCGQSRLVYNVCQDVFEHCTAKLGAKPDLRGMLLLEHLITTTDIDLERFPTLEEITSRLLSSHITNPKIKERFWPHDHFFAEY
jgi:hypothetical protein